MPRKTKEPDIVSEVKEEEKASSSKRTSATQKIASAIKKIASSKKTKKETALKEKSNSTPKKTATKDKDITTTKKAVKAEKEKAIPKKAISKEKSDATSKKAVQSEKQSATSKNTTTKRTTKTKSSVKKVASTSKKEKSIPNSKDEVPEIVSKTNSANGITNIQKFSTEYYDLPYRYNQTVIKILAQTPNSLFVYWDISDEDRENLKKQYGKYFFEITKPVLVIHNETKKYSFEVDIDDFANSWYLHVNDSDSEYKIELGRKPIPINYSYMPYYNEEKEGPIFPVEQPYIYISSSNEIVSPNDRILFNLKNKVLFRNIKTNEIIERDISDFPNIYINGKFVNINKLYEELFSKGYNDDIPNTSFDFRNPSSFGNPSSDSFSSQFK